MSYRKVEPWDSPRNTILEKTSFNCEMSKTDHGFICGLIKKYKPKKIVEIGVAQGGTTGVIIEALNMNKSDCEMYSIDICQTLYSDETKKTGYEYEDNISKYIENNRVKHKILLGKELIDCIDDIGNDIDFVILDTLHTIPGEIIDFLIILPFLSKGAIVVFHDVDLSRIFLNNNNELLSKEYIASKLLFLSCSGEKFINYNPPDEIDNYISNIAAIKINKDTFKNIIDVFYLLTMNWNYYVHEYRLNQYKEFYEKYYDEECLKIYNSVIKFVKNNQKKK